MSERIEKPREFYIYYFDMKLETLCLIYVVYLSIYIIMIKLKILTLVSVIIVNIQLIFKI